MGSSKTFAALIINVRIPYPAIPVRAVFPMSGIDQVSALGDISTWLQQ
jgi:hypothetical protein